jgi:hypothetical protein
MWGRPNKRGVILLDGKEVAETLQCVHCGRHWQVVPGSGAKRGWCAHCNGPSCGKPQCMVCVPAEAKLEFQEALAAEQQAVVNRLLAQYPEITQVGL